MENLLKTLFGIPGIELQEYLHAINIPLSAYGEARRLADAEALFRRMKERGIEPDVVTYNTMINMYAKTDKIAEAQELPADVENKSGSGAVA
jgi:pentatricopeptide repeat protein